MIDHEQAREWVSARADGELSSEFVSALSEHLASCTDCARFGMRLGELSALASELPVESAPTGFEARVDARLRARDARGRRLLSRRWSLVPALAAAVAIATFIVVLQPAARFEVPHAAASDRLLTLRSVYIERTIVFRDPGGNVITHDREKIWWRAPDLLRVERTRRQRGATLRDVRIQNGHDLFADIGGMTGVQPHVSPAGIVPEPLSPTLLLLGKRTGSGPVIAGRPTDRYVVSIGTETRVVYVDVEQASVLGARESIVLAKGSQGPEGSVEKRVLQISYNPAIPDSLFTIPRDAHVGSGDPFEPRPLDRITVVPEATPEGFELISAGYDRVVGAERLLYARGGFQIRIDILSTAPPEYGVQSTRTPATVGKSRPATVVLSLYAEPRVDFMLGVRHVSVSAPLPPNLLVKLASQMFPE